MHSEFWWGHCVQGIQNPIVIIIFYYFSSLTKNISVVFFVSIAVFFPCQAEVFLCTKIALSWKRAVRLLVIKVVFEMLKIYESALATHDQNVRLWPDYHPMEVKVISALICFLWDHVLFFQPSHAAIRFSQTKKHLCTRSFTSLPKTEQSILLDFFQMIHPWLISA